MLWICLGCLSGCKLQDSHGIPFPAVTPLHGWEYHWGDGGKVPPNTGWLEQEPPLNPPGREGNAWLWLRVRLPQLQPNESLYLRGIDEVFETLADGRKIYGFGQLPPPNRYYLGFPWHMISLNPQLGGEYLYLRIYSSGRHIGIFGEPRLGAPAAHLQALLLQDLDRLVVGCLLIFTAMLVFLLFVRQPVKGYRLLCLAALALGSYLICRTEIKQIYAASPVLWKWIEYASLFTGVPALCWFMNGLFGEPRAWKRLILLQVAVEALLLGLAAAGLNSLQDASQPFLLLTLANMTLGLWFVLRGFRRYGGVLVLTGVLAMCAFTGYDILASLRWVPWVRPVSHWGLLLMLIAMLLVLKDQVEKVYHDKRVAEESSRSKSEFLASVSHEIRTPLNAILGFSELMSKDLANDRQASEYLGIIRQAGQTLLLLLNDILDLSRIEARRMPVHLHPVSLPALIAGVQQLFMLGMQEKTLSWEVRIDDLVPERVILDDARLRQILLNLVGNAMKFTHSGFVRLHLSAPSVDAGRVSLRFEVCDSGIGIPGTELGSVFEAFYQVERSDRRHYGGTGLGLSISRRLADLLGGSLNVASTLGEGTCFTLELSEVTVLGADQIPSDTASPDWFTEAADQPVQQPLELPEAVCEPLRLQLKELQQNKSITRIQKFALEIEATGTRIDNSWLIQFAQRLKEALQVFDIGKINALLDQLGHALKEGG